MGMKIGLWKYYYDKGALIEETHYENSKVVLIKSLVEGQWKETRWEDFSEFNKKYYKQTSGFQFGPGKNPEYDFSEYSNDANNLQRI